MLETGAIKEETTCYHCGEDCKEKTYTADDKTFCCEGCRLVFELLDKNKLCTYYSLEKNPGLTQKITVRPGKFAFLDDEKIKHKLIEFRSDTQSHLRFYLPQMHCSSCIWLLEKLHQLNPGIISSRVNFLKKEITIVFNEQKNSLKSIAELLTQIGYEPHISLHDITTHEVKKYDRQSIYKLGIAGFCFGNIMMMSFPDYFSFGVFNEKGLKEYFSYLNLMLALPVVFYCDTEFFVSAWKGMKQKFLNIDAPIALAIVITFLRSVYEIFSGTGAGYLDSMSGIVFFMLIGRFFQDRTYQSLSFDRDYTSYFPVAVTVLENEKEVQLPVSDLRVGQRMIIHSNEIVPADAILFRGGARIDYSFVTGESVPVSKTLGEIIYAGGKQTGAVLELEVIKDVSQSYLTQLWNKKEKGTDKKEKASYIHVLSKYFTFALFSIAAISAVYWCMYDATKIWKVISSVLIVACPCALLLSATFTNGNLLRVLQKGGIYLKNALVVERLAEADTIVLDKTGTITQCNDFTINYEGDELNTEHQQLIYSLCSQSIHPLSKAIRIYLPQTRLIKVKNFRELHGLGLEGMINGNYVKLGSEEFVPGTNTKTNKAGGKVYVVINNKIRGCFSLQNKYRNGFEGLVNTIKDRYNISILSGDNDAEKTYLQNLFGEKTTLLFNQKPEDKLSYVKQLQRRGKKVIMLGDGLNDAGALMQSNTGIAVSDDTNNFSPACDAILEGKELYKLQDFIQYCRNGKKIIAGSFVLSILYNIVGLYFAVTGALEPVIAAILMPLSSISIVLFTTGMSSLLGRKLVKKAELE